MTDLRESLSVEENNRSGCRAVAVERPSVAGHERTGAEIPRSGVPSAFRQLQFQQSAKVATVFRLLIHRLISFKLERSFIRLDQQKLRPGHQSQRTEIPSTAQWDQENNHKPLI